MWVDLLPNMLHLNRNKVKWQKGRKGRRIVGNERIKYKILRYYMFILISKTGLRRILAVTSSYSEVKALLVLL